jgi:hypothetical protein
VSSMTTLDASPNILLIAVIFSNIDFKVNTIAGMWLEAERTRGKIRPGVLGAAGSSWILAF